MAGQNTAARYPSTWGCGKLGEGAETDDEDGRRMTESRPGVDTGSDLTNRCNRSPPAPRPCAHRSAGSARKSAAHVRVDASRSSWLDRTPRPATRQHGGAESLGKARRQTTRTDDG